MIIELAKEHLIRRLREALEWVVEGESQEILANEKLTEEERARQESILRHMEFEITERLEKVKKRLGGGGSEKMKGYGITK